MKLRTSLIGAMALVLAGAAGAQDPAPATPKVPDCKGELHRQFDFWVGDWTVIWNGKVAGENRIEKILDGCALLENWTGAKGHQGKSLNFYDSERGVWHQTWIDHQGLALALDGKFADGKMTLIGKKPNPLNAVITTHRITWTPLPSGEVRQYWDASTDDGKTWEVQFDGIYKHK